MSLLDEFSGTMTAKVTGFNPSVFDDVIRHPTHLRLNLAYMDDLENRVGGFEHIVLCYRGKEHDFTPEEVLAALYEQRKRMEVGE